VKRAFVPLALVLTSLLLLISGCSQNSSSTTTSSPGEIISTPAAPGQVAYWDVLHPNIVGSRVQGLTDVVAVASGSRQDIMFGLDYGLALKTDGTVWNWVASGGGNPFRDAEPSQVAGLSGITAISTGTGNSLALDAKHHVWYWYAYGDLPSGIPNPTTSGPATSTGTPTTPASRNPNPVRVASLDNVNAVAAGMRFSLALRNDGTVRAWGENEWGQLGDGTTSNRDVPARVPGLNDVIAIAAGHYHSLALKSDGTVWAWGDNKSGELGDGTTTHSSTPVRVKGLSGILAIAAGEAHSLALKSDGTVWAWGNNESGQAGDGTQNSPDSPAVTTPVKVKDLDHVAAIADGGIPGGGPDIDVGTVKYRAGYCLALKSDGILWRWGASGDNYEPWKDHFNGTPVKVGNLTDVRFIAAGGNYAVVIVSSAATAPATTGATASTSPPGNNEQVIDQSIVMVGGSDGNEARGLVVGDGSQVLTVWDFEASHADSFRVVAPGGEVYEASMQAFNPQAAMLLLKAEGMKLPAASLGNAAEIKDGLEVIASTIGPDGAVSHERAAIRLYPDSPQIFLSLPDPMGTHAYIGTGAVVTDTQGAVLGMMGIDYMTLFPHPHPIPFIPAVVGADFMRGLLFPANGQPVPYNGPLQALISWGFGGASNGFFGNYDAIAHALTEAEGRLGAPLPANELADYKRAAGMEGPRDGLALTVAYAWPVNLHSEEGKPLARARWVTIQWDRSDNQPNRLFYGGEIGTVDGGFEVTGDIQPLEEAALLAYPGISPERGK
jgi:hypothetical protein